MTSTSVPFADQQRITNPTQGFSTSINNLSVEQRPPGLGIQGNVRTSSNMYAQLPANYHAPVFEGNPAIHSQVISSRIMQPIYQLPGTTTSVRIRPAPTVVSSIPSTTQIRNVQPVQVTGMYRPSIPVSSIVNHVNPQQKVVEEVRIKRPVQTVVLNEPPQVIETVKHEILNDPMIETAHQSTWNSYYQPKAAASVPPPPHATAERGVCPLWLMGLLGLLALGGLIAGIILAARAANGYGSPPAGISQTPGTSNSTVVPETSLYPNYTVTVETTVVNTTAGSTATTTNTTSNQTSTINTTVAPVTKVISVDPVTVAPIVKTVDATIPADQNSTSTTGTSTTGTSSNGTTVEFVPSTSGATTVNSTTTTTTTTTTTSQPVVSDPVSTPSGAQFSSSPGTTTTNPNIQVAKAQPHRHMLKSQQ